MERTKHFLLHPAAELLRLLGWTCELRGKPNTFLSHHVFTCLVRTLTFYIVIGGSGCTTTNAGEDVVVEYSPSGSTVFTRLKTLNYNGEY